MLLPWMLSADLAPGDSKSLSRDWSDIDLHAIRSLDDMAFEMAFGALWAEFGAIGEMEQTDVLARRFARNPAEMHDGCALLYEMMLLTADGKFAAVRDQTAIVVEDMEPVVVHLSHNLVAPEWRRSGLAGWLRALPVQTARDCLAAQKRPAGSPIILVGEMEHRPAGTPPHPRLLAYEKAGYRKVDPSRIPYAQPDFRPTSMIDDSGIQPVPLSLIIRRVGHDAEPTISGADVRAIAIALYKMYAASLRPKDVEPLLVALSTWPGDSEQIPLIPPTTELSA